MPILQICSLFLAEIQRVKYEQGVIQKFLHGAAPVLVYVHHLGVSAMMLHLIVEFEVYED